jgi:hypothetical protein
MPVGVAESEGMAASAPEAKSRTSLVDRRIEGFKVRAAFARGMAGTLARRRGPAGAGVDR